MAEGHQRRVGLYYPTVFFFVRSPTDRLIKLGTSWREDHRRIPQNIPAISAAKFPPTNSALEFLCSFNNVRRDGNTAAHSATLREMKDAAQ